MGTVTVIELVVFVSVQVCVSKSMCLQTTFTWKDLQILMDKPTNKHDEFSD